MEGGGGGGGGGGHAHRRVRSARDVEKIVEMYGPSKMGYRVCVVAVHGIRESGTLQRLLHNLIRDNAWQVHGMEHVGGVVAVHRLMSRSALLLDRVIREVLAIQERGQPLAHGDAEEHPLGDGSSEDEFDFELISRHPLGCDSDQEVQPSRPHLPSAIQGHEEGRHSDDEVRPSHRARLPVRSKDDLEVPMPLPLRRSKSETSLCLTDRHRHDAPRFIGPLSPAPAPETCPILARDVEEDGDFLGQVLLLEYPDARPVGEYATRTIFMSQRMLEAGTGTGEQPLIRAPELVGLAAMAVAGQSPPPHLHQHPDLRASLLDLVQSGEDMRRHPIGSPQVRSLVAELGGRLELVGTDLLIGRLSLAHSLPLLRLVKQNLHLLWDMRVHSTDFKLM